MMVEEQEQWLVCPGDVLGTTVNLMSGEGTYSDGEEIRSLLLGVCTKQSVSYPTDEELQNKEELKVRQIGQPPVVPHQGDIVTGRVVRVTPKLVQVQFLCIGETALKHEFEGIIRMQDVRTTETDKLEMQDCFWPGDIVRTKILSLGDARSYFLTTAEEALGVVQALSEERVVMIPKSQTEMQCPQSQKIFKRKVAIAQ
eukprot:TRINITY_DN31449_c0_g2_i1.p2 TRINITY_DN31449_c0_g2~~TRINITY_DN31449_c0_g2_i1.p2  ORF type:complete len:199 (-),score=36.53 TRINITY_DN31449_c0_g2_i1:85-681(-)